MKTYVLILFSLAAGTPSFAEGIAAGGGGNDTAPQMSQDHQGAWMVECPLRGQIRCESSVCDLIANVKSDNLRNMMLVDFCSQ